MKYISLPQNLGLLSGNTDVQVFGTFFADFHVALQFSMSTAEDQAAAAKAAQTARGLSAMKLLAFWPNSPAAWFHNMRSSLPSGL
jgi:hypothetical protein